MKRICLVVALVAFAFLCGRETVRPAGNPWQEPARITWQQWGNVALGSWANVQGSGITHWIDPEGNVHQTVFYPRGLFTAAAFGGAARDAIQGNGDTLPTVKTNLANVETMLGSTDEGRRLLKDADAARQLAIDVLAKFGVCQLDVGQIQRDYKANESSSQPSTGRYIGDPQARQIIGAGDNAAAYNSAISPLALQKYLASQGQ